MIRARIINEVLGSPKEHVENTLKLLIDNMRQKKDFKIVNETVFEAKRLEDKPLFSSFIELDIEFKELLGLIGFCFDYMPSSIEIMEPDEFKIESIEIGELFNELMARLHQNEMILKNALAELSFSKKEKK